MSRIGYARVSTDDQNLHLQTFALEANGCDHIVTDQGISGARTDRPGLSKVLSIAQPGDTIVVWRLDRLGRSLSHLVGLIASFRVKGIHLASLNEAIDTGTPTGMFVFHMIAALAEFERALISERTRAGMAAARVRGVKLGRPRKAVLSDRSNSHTIFENEKVALVEAREDRNDRLVTSGGASSQNGVHGAAESSGGEH